MTGVKSFEIAGFWLGNVSKTSRFILSNFQEPPAGKIMGIELLDLISREQANTNEMLLQI
jgi:hypothetical protein